MDVRERPAAHRCPFCGEDELLISYGNVAADDGRVQLYCDNPECDVREFEVLALRTGGPMRQDARALELLDEGKLTLPAPDNPFALPLDEFLASGPSVADLLRRRRGVHPRWNFAAKDGAS